MKYLYVANSKEFISNAFIILNDFDGVHVVSIAINKLIDQIQIKQRLPLDFSLSISLY